MHRPLSARRPLYFLHIPKTAGTSLISLLHERFPEEEVCPAYLWSSLLRIPGEELPRYRLFRGHFYHYLRDYLPCLPVMFTFLRDPLERALSHYEHILREPAHYLHHKARAQGSLTAFLADPETAAIVTNFQTRALGLDLDPVAFAAALTPAELNGHRLEQLLESASASPAGQAGLLRRSLGRLEQMAFVGLVERYEESLADLFRTFGWGPIGCVPRLNTSSNRTDRTALTPWERELLRARLKDDYVLYEHAVRLHTARRRTATAA